MLVCIGLSTGLSMSLSADVPYLPGLANPNDIEVDSANLYIADGNSVYIFNKNDYSLKRKFGKTGEGPGEFVGSPGTGRAPLDLDLRKDTILVNSFGKITLFTKEGKYVKELKPLDQSRGFIYFGKGYVANLNRGIDGVRYRTLNTLDETLKRDKMLFKREHSIQGPGGGYNPLEGPLAYSADGDRLFVCWESDFIIRVFDTSGKELDKITQTITRREVTDSDKKRIDHALQTDPRFKPIYQMVKPLRFPTHFPVLSNVIATGGKVYAVCRQDENKKTECYVFDLKGKLDKKAVVDLKYDQDERVYPYTIFDGTIFQMVEDEDEEEWKIHTVKI
jgi:hypothetical protein